MLVPCFCNQSNYLCININLRSCVQLHGLSIRRELPLFIKYFSFHAEHFSGGGYLSWRGGGWFQGGFSVILLCKSKKFELLRKGEGLDPPPLPNHTLQICACFIYNAGKPTLYDNARSCIIYLYMYMHYTLVHVQSWQAYSSLYSVHVHD